MADAPFCRLYLVTPPLGLADLPAFAPRFAAALAAGDVASALVRIAPEALGDARRIAELMVEAAAPYDAAVLIEGEPRLAARVGADGRPRARCATPTRRRGSPTTRTGWNCSRSHPGMAVAGRMAGP